MLRQIGLFGTKLASIRRKPGNRTPYQWSTRRQTAIASIGRVYDRTSAHAIGLVQPLSNVRNLSDQPSRPKELTSEELLVKLREIESSMAITEAEKEKLLYAIFTDKLVDFARDMPPPFGRNVEGWKLRRDVVKQLQLEASKQNGDVILLEPVSKGATEDQKSAGERR